MSLQTENEREGSMTHLRGDVIVRPENDDLDRDIRDPDVHQHLRVIHRNAASHYEGEGVPERAREHSQYNGMVGDSQAGR